MDRYIIYIYIRYKNAVEFTINRMLRQIFIGRKEYNKATLKGDNNFFQKKENEFYKQSQSKSIELAALNIGTLPDSYVQSAIGQMLSNLRKKYKEVVGSLPKIYFRIRTAGGISGTRLISVSAAEIFCVEVVKQKRFSLVLYRDGIFLSSQSYSLVPFFVSDLSFPLFLHFFYSPLSKNGYFQTCFYSQKFYKSTTLILGFLIQIGRAHV